jgi:hypothetical protein
MSVGRKCRECHRKVGETLAVCKDCTNRLGHYDGEEVRQMGLKLGGWWQKAVRREIRPSRGERRRADRRGRA